MPDTAYLFPVPGPALRRLLDLKAQLGESFSDDDAAADVMLDLDLVRFYGREPQPTGMLHAYRYYARRWGWTKDRVAKAWSGRPERVRSDGRVVPAAEPWLAARADGWRRFRADPPEPSADAAGDGPPDTRPTAPDTRPTAPDTRPTAPDTRPTKSADFSAYEAIARHAPNGARHAPDKQEQTSSDPEEGEEGDAPARDALWDGRMDAPPDLAALGPDAEAHAAAVAEAAALDTTRRLAWARRVLRAGNAPAADFYRDLGVRAARYGDGCLVVALAITDHGADRRSRQPQRLRYLDAVLDSLADHRRRARTRPEPPAADDAPGRSRRAAGGAPNARERANQLSARDLIDGAGDALAILRADPDLGGDAAG